MAGGRVLLAKRLRRMPHMAAALASGSVTEAHARALGRCLTPRTIAAFERDESWLVEKAVDLEADEFEFVVTRWLMLNDESGPDPGSERPSEFHASGMLAGRTRLDGELDLEDSAEFMAELDARYDDLWRDDQAAGDDDPLRTRSHSQRMAAALVEMARRSSAVDDSDGVDHVVGGAGASTAAVRGGRRRRRPRRRPISNRRARRRHTGAAVDFATLAVRLDHRPGGHGRRLAARRSRAADVHRVGGTASGTDRTRPRLHRPRLQAEGPMVRCAPRQALPEGPTDLSNLVLLCKRHHKLVHAGVIKLLPCDLGSGWLVTRRDGSPLRQRPPPGLAA